MMKEEYIEATNNLIDEAVKKMSISISSDLKAFLFEKDQKTGNITSRPRFTPIESKLILELYSFLAVASIGCQWAYLGKSAEIEVHQAILNLSQRIVVKIKSYYLSLDKFDGVLWISIFPQFNIDTLSTPYRVDFLFECFIDSQDMHAGVFWRKEKPPPLVRLCVELDGHDFHEKTKEQASRDKERDRAIMKAGFDIIHFTGSDVWNKCPKVMDEIFEHLFMLVQEKVK